MASVVAVAGCGPKQTQAQREPARQTESATAPVEKVAVSSGLPKLWDFWATWCPPCKELKPVIEALEEEYKGRIEVRSIDVDQNKELAARFEVKAIPTLVFLDGAGKELSRVVGLVPKDTIVGRFVAHGFIR